jgi:hypothetical protein
VSIRLGDYYRDERIVEMQVGEEKAMLAYRPSAYTPRVESELQSALERNRPSAGMAELLAGVLISWEVLDEEGNEIEPTMDNLMDLPSVLLGAAITAIGEDITGEADRKNLGGGSRPKGKSGRSLSGTR